MILIVIRQQFIDVGQVFFGDHGHLGGAGNQVEMMGQSECFRGAYQMLLIGGQLSN